MTGEELKHVEPIAQPLARVTLVHIWAYLLRCRDGQKRRLRPDLLFPGYWDVTRTITYGIDTFAEPPPRLMGSPVVATYARCF